MSDTVSNSPTIYVIAGPNGAGKTTFATEFLPNHVNCREFLNADMIAAGLAPFAPESQSLRAGRLMLERFDELRKKRVDFAVETTLSGRAYVKTLREMRASGYRVLLYFLWLPDAETAIARVANRVNEGGHNIPEVDVRRRYSAGVRNLFRLYRPIVDAWWLYNAFGRPPRLIAFEDDGHLTIKEKLALQSIQRQAEGGQ